MYVLYVEDDIISRKVMEMMLQFKMKNVWFTILEDSDGFDKKLKTLTTIPDLIFLDIHVQPYSGFDMLKMVRSNPIFNRSKVIALTASVMSEEIEQLETAGFDGAISKPLQKDLFPELVHRIMQGEQVWHVA